MLQEGLGEDFGEIWGAFGVPWGHFLQDFQYFLEHVFEEAPTSTFEEDFALILDYLFVTCLIGFANGLKTEKTSSLAAIYYTLSMLAIAENR